MNRIVPSALDDADAVIGGTAAVFDRLQQQTEEALQRSEERWRLIYESEPECVKVVSADGRLLEMNPAGLLMIEAESLDQARCQPLLNFIAPEHRDAFWKLHQRVIGGESGQLSFEIIGLNGTRRWLETHAVPFRAADGSICQLGITRDIHERRRAEEALLESEQRFRELYESSRDAIFVEDTEGYVLDVNPAACRLHGMTREQLLGRNVRDLVPESQRANLEREFLKLLAGELSTAEGFSLRADGTSVPVELNVSRIVYRGQPGLLLHVRDITERKQTEETLRQSEQKFGKVFHNNPDAILLTSMDGRILDANAGFTRLTGYAVDEARGRTTVELGFWQNLSDRERFITGLRTNGRVHDLEAPMRTRDGQLRTCMLSGELMELAGEQIIVGIVRNNTEQRQAHEELRASRERLAVLSRQLIAAQESERRHLARELHDEIGQSLTGIKLNLKAMQQPEAARRLATLVTDTLAVVDRTLQQVRSLALDLRPSQLDDIGLAAALRWCLDRQAQRAGFAAQFSADPPDCVAPAEIAIACFRVVQESLTNISRHANARHVRVELCQTEADLELIVQDNGSGFDVQAARDRAARGASLGLLGMQERVELVSGQLEIQSNSAGTTVHARFPIRAERD